jgi:hypothetical protein
MLNRTLKGLIALMILAGAPAAPVATARDATRRSVASSAPRTPAPAPHPHQRALEDEGCRERPAPVATATPPATCS